MVNELIAGVVGILGSGAVMGMVKLFGRRPRVRAEAARTEAETRAAEWKELLDAAQQLAATHAEGRAEAERQLRRTRKTLRRYGEQIARCETERAHQEEQIAELRKMVEELRAEVEVLRAARDVRAEAKTEPTRLREVVTG